MEEKKKKELAEKAVLDLINRKKSWVFIFEAMYLPCFVYLCSQGNRMLEKSCKKSGKLEIWGQGLDSETKKSQRRKTIERSLLPPTWFSEKTDCWIFPKNYVFSNNTWFKHLLSWSLTMAICLNGTLPIQNLVKFLPWGSTMFKRTNTNRTVVAHRVGIRLLGFESWPWWTHMIYLIFNPRRLCASMQKWSLSLAISFTYQCALLQELELIPDGLSRKRIC
jgi:hypothetical protein